MNRDQQRKNAKDQRRIEARKRARQSGRQPQPALKQRANAGGKVYATTLASRRALPSWFRWAVVGGVLLAVVAVVFLLDPLGLRAPLPGAQIRTQGNNHVEAGTAHQAYLTDPPASGPHFPVVPRRGIYTVPFANEYLPHFMEHGGVEVQYNSSASQAVVDSLTSIVNSELDRGAGQVLIAPRPDMPCQVSVTSWQRISVFNDTNCESGWLGQQSTPKVDPNNKAWQGHAFDPKSSKDRDFVKTWIERNQCSYDPENQCGSGSKGKGVEQTPKPGEATVIASLGTATPIAGTPSAPAPGAGTQVPTPVGTETPLQGPLALPSGTP